MPERGLADGPGRPPGVPGAEGRDALRRHAEYAALLGRSIAPLGEAPPLTPEEERRLEELAPTLLPAGVHVRITRNYGETAKEKSDELLYHMMIAIVSVTLLIWLALGRRYQARGCINFHEPHGRQR